MANAIVDLRFKLNLSEETVEKIAGRPDDNSQEWHEEAWKRVEEAVREAPAHYLSDFVTDEPEVEVTM